MSATQHPASRAPAPSSNTSFLLVLAHPRTGSSLLMQTLHLLGAPLVGSKDRPDIKDPSPNPRGYFEDKPFLKTAFSEDNIERLTPQLPGHALKTDMNAVLREDSDQQLNFIADWQPRLFATYRQPMEMLSSNHIFSRTEKNSLEEFRNQLAFLGAYRRNYVRLAKHMKRQGRDLAKRILLVPYQAHLDDPRQFVEQVRQHAGLPFDSTKQQAAIDNIDPALYRHRFEELPRHFHQWYERHPVRPFYELLSSTPADRVWDELATWPR